MAQSRHHDRPEQCLLLGVKRTFTRPLAIKIRCILKRAPQGGLNKLSAPPKCDRRAGFLLLNMIFCKMHTRQTAFS